MAELLPNSKVFYGDTEGTALHQNKKSWPYVDQPRVGIFIIYNHHMRYDHPVFYDGLMPRLDISATIGNNRRRPAGRARPTRGAAAVGETRGSPTPGPTRHKSGSGPLGGTRVVLFAPIGVEPTRRPQISGPTRRHFKVGPTRQRKGA